MPDSHDLTDPYERHASQILAPPTTLWGTLRHLGPGFILSASIVGSGELIATTHLGAKAGFIALWVILVSCFVKVAVQLEFGRQTLLTGRTTMETLNALPGPRFGRPKSSDEAASVPASWSIWLWLALMMIKPLQSGAIIGLVAIILSMLIPGLPIWAWCLMVAIVVSLMVYRGYYGFIEKVCLVMMGLFTLLTLVSLFQLQWTPNSITGADLMTGLSFQLPTTMVIVALGAFGITGVGGDEIMAYNYWLIEKGYARNTGPREDSDEWASRAKGWIRVMYIDAVLAMIVYTVMTAAFYLLGAAILHSQGLVPEKSDIVETLSRIYTETLGPSASYLFLFGALAVLFSTLLASLAAWTRLYSDAAGQIGLLDYRDVQQRHRAFAFFAWIFPAIWASCFLFFKSPAAMVITGGVSTTIILFIVVWAALYFRYSNSDKRLRPSMLYDIALWISSIAIAMVGVLGVWKIFFAVE